MRRILLINLLLIICYGLFAQDSIRAINIFRHSIVNGKRQLQNSIAEQKTYDLKDRLVLQIHYYDSVPNVKSFTRFYYDENKLLSEETFTIELKVIRIKRYRYDENGNLVSEKIYSPGKNKLENTKTIKYNYAGGKPVQKQVLNAANKWLEKQRIDYNGNQIITHIKYSKRTGESLKNELITEEFAAGGERLLLKKVERTFRDNHVVEKETSYSYDEEGKLIGESLFRDGKLKQRKEYSWYVNGTLNRILVYNGEDELIDYLNYEYLQRITDLGNKPMYDLSKPLE